MARARNIKPAFFNNDLLAELEPIERLAFIGLWTIVDFKGCGEYRPKKIKAMILPYDDCDMENIMINLDKYGFIRIYSSQGETYYKVINFEKHQNPHKNERDKGSDIPDYNPETLDSKGLEQDSRIIAINPDKNGTNRADSLIMNPDSLSLIADNPKPTRSQFVKPTPNELENYLLTKQLSFEQAKHESEKFYNYYESNGWKVGKNAMVSWKHALSGWITRNNGFKKPELNLNSGGWENGK